MHGVHDRTRTSTLSPSVKQLSRVYQGKVFSLFKERVVLPNGVVTDMDTIRHPGAAAIVPLLEDRHVVMIRQYRHAIGEFLLEIPAGTLDKGETALECARRELVEEVGYEASKFRKIGEIVPVPGYSNERIHIFLATGLKLSRQDLNQDEVLEIELLPLSTALDMVRQREIYDAKTIAGLFLASKVLNVKG